MPLHQEALASHDASDVVARSLVRLAGARRPRLGAMSAAMRYLSKVHIGFDFFAGRSASARNLLEAARRPVFGWRAGRGLLLLPLLLLRPCDGLSWCVVAHFCFDSQCFRVSVP